MFTEIEAKLKVDSLEDVAQKLAALGAGFVEEQVHKDCYFDDVAGSFKNNDCCLRIRQQFIGGSERIFLTYKGPKEKGRFKKRQEIETEVAEAEPIESLLTILGYKKDLVFEKRRRIWQLDECEISLDQLPILGCFVEIEGRYEDEIAEVQKKLHLTDLPHIPTGYALLMEQKLQQLDSDEREILFEET